LADPQLEVPMERWNWSEKMETKQLALLCCCRRCWLSLGEQLEEIGLEQRKNGMPGQRWMEKRLGLEFA